MDIKKDDFFEEVTEEKTNEPPRVAMKEDFFGEEPKKATDSEDVAPLPLPFPKKDYDKKGQLKKLRGRMVKKLLKNEWKHYFPVTLCLMGLLLLTGIFCGVGLRKTDFSNDPTTTTPLADVFSISSLLLFIGCCMGALVFTAAYPIARYEKNFFQSEGYLTFSIPASMEEHVAAKRIAAVLCTYAMALVLLLSVFLAVWISGGMKWGIDLGVFAIGSDVYLQGGHAVAYLLENLLSAMISGVMLPSIYAVLTCLLAKTSGKRKTGVTILLVFIGVGILDSVSASFFSVETLLPQTVAWAHISAWLGIVAQTAITVFCIAFEIWYLKHKLDLK